MAVRSLATLIGVPDEYLRLGACTLAPVAQGRNEETRERIAAAGPGPLAVGLATEAPGTRRIWTGGSPAGSTSGCWGGHRKAGVGGILEPCPALHGNIGAEDQGSRGAGKRTNALHRGEDER